MPSESSRVSALFEFEPCRSRYQAPRLRRFLSCSWLGLCDGEGLIEHCIRVHSLQLPGISSIFTKLHPHDFHLHSIIPHSSGRTSFIMLAHQLRPASMHFLYPSSSKGSSPLIIGLNNSSYMSSGRFSRKGSLLSG